MAKKLPTLTKEQKADFALFAKTLATIAAANDTRKRLNAKYADFMDAWEPQLREGIDLDGLHLQLKIARSLVIEEL